MVSAIVYNSSTGFTRRYAELLGEKTGLLAYDMNGKSLPPKGSEVIYLGWLRAGSLAGYRKAARRYRVRALGVVGMSPTPNGKAMEDMTLPAFYLPGGYRPDALSGLDKLMMSAMGRMLARKAPKNEEEAMMIRAFQTGCDSFDPESLTPVTEFLKEQGRG